MRAIHCALIATALVAWTPAIARDQLGNAAIQAGDFNKAEQTIVSEMRFNPDMPELMLNLAYVYRHTGRISEARALYRQVLSAPPITLKTGPNASVTSYDVARAGLLIKPVTLASR
jgi:tetratricopeptide (TPR) repeat protein